MPQSPAFNNLTRYDDVDVSELEVLILDESDVLLDMGFIFHIKSNEIFWS